MPEHADQALQTAWREGIAGGALELRQHLALPAAAADDEVAFRLVEKLVAQSLESLHLASQATADDRYSFEEIAVRADEGPIAGRSFLSRLGGLAPLAAQKALRQVEDVRTLMAVMRGGSLAQRKAAMLRLSERLADPRGIPSEQVRQAVLALAQHRDVELSYELLIVRSRLPGPPARQAKAEADECQKALEIVDAGIAQFWEGESQQEPIAALPAHRRALLLMRCRDMPDRIVQHVCALIEGSDGVTQRDDRLLTLSLLRTSADGRLAASLVAILQTAIARGPIAQGGDVVLAMEAARALARIDDPRARPMLRAAYERSVVDLPRAIFAGALGGLGDYRGADYVRKLLRSDDAATLLAALEAMETVGSPNDGPTVAAMLSRADSRLVAQAVRTLARLGDRRVLGELVELRQRTTVSAMWAEIEDATAAIRARMELAGEETAEFDSFVIQTAGTAMQRRDIKRADPTWRRLQSVLHYGMGRLCLAFGAVRWATRRLEAASQRRPRWGKPLWSLAVVYARQTQDVKALESFRRAITADRAGLEANGMAMNALALTFLRRAETMERQGRPEIAAGLIEEALTLDLRAATTALRFELERRHAARRLSA